MPYLCHVVFLRAWKSHILLGRNSTPVDCSYICDCFTCLHISHCDIESDNQKTKNLQLGTTGVKFGLCGLIMTGQKQGYSPVSSTEVQLP